MGTVAGPMIVDLSYVVTPFLAWLVAGGLKFVINSVRARTWAFGMIGYGGLPSNHSAIVSSVAALIGVREGIDTAAFGVALALAFIVILDAKSLRREVGKHAVAINTMRKDGDPRLRERVGHTTIEIVAGLAVGVAVGSAVGLFLAD